MIVSRLAVPGDAQQLLQMNAAFNEVNDLTAQDVRQSLLHSPEIVIIAECDGLAAGFLCAQVHFSFCYRQPVAEVTEMYVSPEYRRRGAAQGMLAFLEAHLKEQFAVDELHLLTGVSNLPARHAYEKAGFTPHDEQYMFKRLR